MSELIPTCRLRFLKHADGLEMLLGIENCILQQWWHTEVEIGVNKYELNNGEWRDVPIEEEK